MPAPTHAPDSRVLQAVVPAELAARVQQLAKEERRSVSQTARFLIERELDRRP